MYSRNIKDSKLLNKHDFGICSIFFNTLLKYKIFYLCLKLNVIQFWNNYLMEWKNGTLTDTAVNSQIHDCICACSCLSLPLPSFPSVRLPFIKDVTTSRLDNITCGIGDLSRTCSKAGQMLGQFFFLLQWNFRKLVL